MTFSTELRSRIDWQRQQTGELTYTLHDDGARFPVTIELFIGYRVSPEIGGNGGRIVEWWLDEVADVKLSFPTKPLEKPESVPLLDEQLYLWTLHALLWANEQSDQIETACVEHSRNLA